MEIDLINPDAYATNGIAMFFSRLKRSTNVVLSGQITEDDEKLLEEETASPANLKRYCR